MQSTRASKMIIGIFTHSNKVEGAGAARIKDGVEKQI